MSWQLGEHVLRGQLRSDGHYGVHLVFEVRGRDVPVMAELTGKPSPDLLDKTIRFEAAFSQHAPTEAESRKATKGFAPRQIGVTGTMTAEGWVRTFDCSVEEFMRRSEAGEQPPTRWQRRLYLEWFSQNGRVEVELAGPEIEYEVAEDEWIALPASSPPPHHADRPKEERDAPGALEITALKPDGATEQMTFIDGGDPVEAAEFMDRLIEQDAGEPIASLFGEPRQLPRPDDLSDDQAENVLKSLLVELATCGVALHICEHYSPREAYRLLVDRILHENEIHPELKGSGWSQEFMTSEYCPACEADAERRWAESEELEEGEENGE